MDDDRLFGLDSIPEVPLFREPRRAKAARGVAIDARFANDYPPEWNRCPMCNGWGGRWSRDGGQSFASPVMALAPDDSRLDYGTVDRPGKWRRLPCPECLGMGSLKGRVRLEAGHRCERCLHSYMPKGDAKMLGVEPTPYRWSPCDARCAHGGAMRYKTRADGEWEFYADAPRGWPHGGIEEMRAQARDFVHRFATTEAEWRILTVHHLDGDKSNCRWWNLAALCQRDHLEIQAKVVMERVYPHEHSEWFKPHAAGYYAHAYLGEDLTRDETLDRLDELLALELTPA